MAAAIVLMAALTIAASFLSLAWHIPTLGAAAAAGSFALIIAVLLLARRTPPTSGDKSGPSQ